MDTRTGTANKNTTGVPRKPPADVRKLQDPEYDEATFDRALDRATRRVDDPVIDLAVQTVDSLIGPSVVCPLCGKSDWYLIDTERFLRVWAPSELTDAEVESADELPPFDTIRVLGLACTGCHFIRLHNFSENFGESQTGGG